ncbi:MAG: L-threonylcarbamoyladenylate synthase [Actinomycetota bacterium]|nr:L-threonylcarbamoyladenylate synthase [Actinomycetota bacterium]
MSELLKANSPEAIGTACQVLSAGLPVGLPTDAAYVLAVDPYAAGASDRLFAVLRRPRSLDLPVLVATVFQAESLTTALPEAAQKLMRRCWPGALTLVLPRHPDLAADLGDDDLTVGVRMPGTPAARDLCARCGPVAVATATPGPGQPALQTAPDVVEVFGDSVPVVLDDGRCTGLPATVVDATGTDPHLIREGRLPWVEILEAIKA